VMTHDESRLSEALHELVDAQPFEPDLGTIERRGRHIRRRATATRSVAGLGLAAVAAAALAVSGALSTQSGTRANPLTIPTTTALHGGPLVALAADITAHQLHQPGNATLVISLGLTRVGKHLQYSEGDRGAELFTDAGKYYDASLDPPSDTSYTPRSDEYYDAHPVSLLRAEIAAHVTTSNAQFADEEAAAIKAAGGNLSAARRQMAEALRGVVTCGDCVLSTRPRSFGLVPVDAWIWEDSKQALEKGAGNPEVRAGVLRLIATLPDVTVTHTSTDGRPTLTLRVGRPEAGMTHYQSLVINAHTGTPVTFSSGPGTDPPEATITYHVRRVTVSAFTAGRF
jgi:hypothetical protein